MFQTRTSPQFKTIRDLVHSGELGEIRRTNWIVTNWFRSGAYYASGGWRATWGGEGGGVLLNQCPHNLDLYQWIVGMPTKVRAFCGFGKFHEIEVEDAVTAYLEHPNGATGVFVTTTGEAPGTDRLEIVGDRGRMVFEHGKIVFDRTTESVQRFSDTTDNMFPSMSTWRCEIPTPGPAGSHLAVLQNFIDAILDGVALIAPGEEGLHSIELANSMIYSSWTGTTVELPLDASLYEHSLRQHVDASKHHKTVQERTADNLTASFH
jgi:predicted dehydrogenase